MAGLSNVSRWCITREPTRCLITPLAQKSHAFSHGPFRLHRTNPTPPDRFSLINGATGLILGLILPQHCETRATIDNAVLEVPWPPSIPERFKPSNYEKSTHDHHQRCSANNVSATLTNHVKGSDLSAPRHTASSFVRACSRDHFRRSHQNYARVRSI